MKRWPDRGQIEAVIAGFSIIKIWPITHRMLVQKSRFPFLKNPHFQRIFFINPQSTIHNGRALSVKQMRYDKPTVFMREGILIDFRCIYL